MISTYSWHFFLSAATKGTLNAITFGDTATNIINLNRQRYLIGGAISAIAYSSLGGNVPDQLYRFELINIVPALAHFPKTLTSDFGTTSQPDEIALPVNQPFSIAPIPLEQFNGVLEYLIENIAGVVSLSGDVALMFNDEAKPIKV